MINGMILIYGIIAFVISLIVYLRFKRYKEYSSKEKMVLKAYIQSLENYIKECNKNEEI